MPQITLLNPSKPRVILVILKLSFISSCVIFLSDEDNQPLWELNVLINVNSMTSSLEHVWAGDIEHLEQHSTLTIDSQYSESSGAITNNRTLENLQCDEIVEGQFHLNSAEADER